VLLRRVRPRCLWCRYLKGPLESGKSPVLSGRKDTSTPPDLMRICRGLVRLSRRKPVRNCIFLPISCDHREQIPPASGPHQATCLLACFNLLVRSAGLHAIAGEDVGICGNLAPRFPSWGVVLPASLAGRPTRRNSAAVVTATTAANAVKYTY
jgi:hypothetical protein